MGRTFIKFPAFHIAGTTSFGAEVLSPLSSNELSWTYSEKRKWSRAWISGPVGGVALELEIIWYPALIHWQVSEVYPFGKKVKLYPNINRVQMDKGRPKHKERRYSWRKHRKRRTDVLGVKYQKRQTTEDTHMLTVTKYNEVLNFSKKKANRNVVIGYRQVIQNESYKRSVNITHN